jgi:hypothetical protein
MNVGSNVGLISNYEWMLLLYNALSLACGGEPGIRTQEGLAPLPVFKTGAFDHSASSPHQLPLHFIRLMWRSQTVCFSDPWTLTLPPAILVPCTTCETFTFGRLATSMNRLRLCRHS